MNFLRPPSIYQPRKCGFRQQSEKANVRSHVVENHPWSQLLRHDPLKTRFPFASADFRSPWAHLHPQSLCLSTLHLPPLPVIRRKQCLADVMGQLPNKRYIPQPGKPSTMPGIHSAKRLMQTHVFRLKCAQPTSHAVGHGRLHALEEKQAGNQDYSSRLPLSLGCGDGVPFSRRPTCR